MQLHDSYNQKLYSFYANAKANRGIEFDFAVEKVEFKQKFMAAAISDDNLGCIFKVARPVDPYCFADVSCLSKSIYSKHALCLLFSSSWMYALTGFPDSIC